MTIAVRILLAVGAVAAVTFAVVRRADVRDCRADQAQAFALASTHSAAPPDGGLLLARRIIRVCRGSDALVASAQALTLVGALDGARRLATTAIDRDPQAFQAHVALAAVLAREGRTHDAARERAEAVRLNPLAPPPTAPRLGPDGRALSG